LERNKEVQHILQTFLTAGDRARAAQDLVKAERYYYETIKVAVREFGKLIPEIALAKFNLSKIYLERAEFIVAEAFASSALNVFFEVYGAEHPTTVMARHHLDEVQLAQNDTEAATTQRRTAQMVARTSA
jgi:hypothetical protein